MDTQLLIHFAVLAFGVVLLVAGGEILVRGAVALATRFGVAPIIVGLTIVAFGTSAPELALNIAAAVSGNSGLSLGNIVGSNIANIGLILGLAALFSPLVLHTSVVRRELPLMLLASVALVLLCWLPPGLGAGGAGGPAISRLEGLMLLIGFVAFLTLMVRVALTGGEGSELLAQEAQELEESVVDDASPVGAVVKVLGGLVLLAGGGKLAEHGAVAAATALGVSNEVIGLTVVALATSLPELVTSVVAARRGHADLAVGNIVGSNLFNILLVMGTTAMVRPVAVIPEASQALAAMMVFSLALVPVSLTRSRRMSGWIGAMLLLGYLSYIAFEIWRVTASG